MTNMIIMVSAMAFVQLPPNWNASRSEISVLKAPALTWQRRGA
jgi:hypothetical protein